MHAEPARSRLQQGPARRNARRAELARRDAQTVAVPGFSALWVTPPPALHHLAAADRLHRRLGCRDARAGSAAGPGCASGCFRSPRRKPLQARAPASPSTDRRRRRRTIRSAPAAVVEIHKSARIDHYVVVLLIGAVSTSPFQRLGLVCLSWKQGSGSSPGSRRSTVSSLRANALQRACTTLTGTSPAPIRAEQLVCRHSDTGAALGQGNRPVRVVT